MRKYPFKNGVCFVSRDAPHRRIFRKIDVSLSKKQIRKTLSRAVLNVPYLKSCTLENVNLGFRTSGIRPFDPSIILEHNYINDFQDVLDADFAITGSQIN